MLKLSWLKCLVIIIIIRIKNKNKKNKIEKDTIKGRNETIISIPDLHGFQLIAIFSIYYLSLAHLNLTTDQEPSHVNEHEAKPIPLFKKTFKISGPNQFTKVIGHFRSISVNVIYCKTCMLCEMTYIGETGRRLADRFCEHLRDVEKNDIDASKPFNFPNHSHHNTTICALSLHYGNTESRKNLEQKFIF